MTCQKFYRCSFCEPPRVQERNRCGRLGNSYVLLLTYAFAEGRLDPRHPERQSKTPHLEFCPGCLGRIFQGRAPLPETP